MYQYSSRWTTRQEDHVMQPIDSGRTVRSYTQRIQAPPDRVFPLLCPVREAEWLAGWSEGLEMVHSDSGRAEDGCVFITHPPGRPATVWMITRHDPAARVVEFVRVTAELLATRLRIAVAGEGEGASSVHITYTFTPLGATGRAFLRENHSEDAFRGDMAWWEDSMNHWLRCGETLAAGAH
jgi:polyketide cyclase/dehydrase/lipid transport protein